MVIFIIIIHKLARSLDILRHEYEISKFIN